MKWLETVSYMLCNIGGTRRVIFLTSIRLVVKRRCSIPFEKLEYFVLSIVDIRVIPHIRVNVDLFRNAISLPNSTQLQVMLVLGPCLSDSTLHRADYFLTKITLIKRIVSARQIHRIV